MSIPTIAEIKEQVQRFFGDQSRTQSETKDGLEDLRDDIESLIDTLPKGD